MLVLYSWIRLAFLPGLAFYLSGGLSKKDTASIKPPDQTRSSRNKLKLLLYQLADPSVKSRNPLENPAVNPLEDPVVRVVIESAI